MKFPAGMFTKYMVLGLSLAGACKGHVPQDTRCSSLTGISVLKVCLTESLTLLPNRVNRLRHKKRGTPLLATSQPNRNLQEK